MNDVTTSQKIMNELQKLEYRLYSYSSSSMKYKTIILLKHYYFLQELSWKNKLLLETIELTHFVQESKERMWKGKWRTFLKYIFHIVLNNGNSEYYRISYNKQQQNSPKKRLMKSFPNTHCTIWVNTFMFPKRKFSWDYQTQYSDK